jgi:hypothetical protein
MRSVRHTGYHETEKIASALNLTMQRTWDVLVRLENEGRVNRTSVDEAFKGALWRLDELQRAPVPQTKKPNLMWSALQFTDVTYDKNAGIWREQASQYTTKACVLHYTNFTFEDKTGVPATNIRAQIFWDYSHDSIGPTFSPALWLDEEYGHVDIPVGFSRKLIIGIKSQEWWNGYSNPRMKAGDKHHVENQTLPLSGTLTVKLIGETDEILLEKKYKWAGDIQNINYFPDIKPLS